jgi:hypothetical protein
MQIRKYIPGLSSEYLVILLAALVKFAIHLYTAPGYSLFIDEFYTAALSRHLAFGYVDLPPLVPVLMALSRALLGESLLAMHVFPALAGAFTLVFVCLITREFGGRTFAVALAALGFLGGTLWLGLNSIFAYDSFDQLVLAGFLFTLARFLKTGNRRLWIVLGLLAGLALNTKMTLLFMGPGFLAGLLISKHRRDLLTGWPWLGAGICLLLITPYLLWQVANGWPTLEYWTAYSTGRVYQASPWQYFVNILAYMSPFLLPFWIAGLYRVFRRIGGVHYGFFGVMFLVTLALLFWLHATLRLLAASFMPLLAAGAVCFEELFERISSVLPWRRLAQSVLLAYLVVGFVFIAPGSLPVFPLDSMPDHTKILTPLYRATHEFNGQSNYLPIMLIGRMGWEEVVESVAGEFNKLSAQERAVAGIYADWYWTAGAVDMYGPRYGLPHAVSGSLTYYLWGPGYSWDVMLLLTNRTNPMDLFFNQCENKGPVKNESPMLQGSNLYIFVCRDPKVPAERIWRTARSYR